MAESKHEFLEEAMMKYEFDFDNSTVRKEWKELIVGKMRRLFNETVFNNSLLTYVLNEFYQEQGEKKKLLGKEKDKKQS